jgi:hypothetical protein
MASFPEWRVVLEGDRDTLGILASSFPEPDCHLAREGDQVVMTSSSFSGISNVRDVRVLAEDLVQRLSGAARLVTGWRGDVKVGQMYQVDEQGVRRIFMIAEPVTIQIRGSPIGFTFRRADGSEEVHRPADPAAKWLKASGSDPRVARALRLLGKDPLLWVDVARLMELIESAVPRERLDQWVSKNRRDLLIRTANSAGAVGDEARHGVERVVPPPSPMPLSEAATLVKDLSTRWLNSL